MIPAAVPAAGLQSMEKSKAKRFIHGCVTTSAMYLALEVRIHALSHLRFARFDLILHNHSQIREWRS